MADRTTKVRLLAEVNGYIAGMERASRATREMADDSTAKLAQQREAFNQLGQTALAVGVIAAVGVGLAVKRYRDFDQAMSNVQAATQETASNMDQLRAAALRAGGETVFTAVEAANAIEELGKAGLSTAQILGGGLDAALSLAAAGQLEVARAAEITAITLKQFELDGSQATLVSDLLAAGAGKAAGDVEDLAQALNQAALVAAQTGLSVEETTGVLSAFASAGLLGSDAGTSFRSMLQRLTPQSAEAQRELDRLGISAYDAQGSFIGAAAFAGELQDGLRGLTDEQRNAALAVIFGSDAVRAASVFYEEGAAGIQEWIDATNDSGFAARVAADRLNNLNGDLEKLNGAFETTLIKGGTGANEVLRDMVQTATFLVDAVGDLPRPALDAGLALGTAATAAGLLGGAAVLGVPKIAEYRAGLAALGTTARSAAVGVGAATIALTAATLAIAAIANDAADRAGAIDAFGESLDQASGSITDYTRELVAQRLQTEGAIQLGRELGLTTEELVDLTLQGSDAIEAYAERQRAANAENAAAVTQYDTVTGALVIVSDQLDAGRRAWELNRDATEASRRATEENEAALADLRGEAADAGGEISELADIIRGFGSASLNTRDASRQFQAAIDDATKALAENGATFDTNTEAGRANEEALDQIARSARELAASILEETGSQEQATAAIQAGRDALIAQATSANMSAEAAAKLADDLGLIPANIATGVSVVGIPEAQGEIDRFLRTNDGRTIRIGADFRGSPIGLTARENGGIEAYANGGIREGIYRGRPGGLIKFAEPSTRWEAFLSGKPGQERRNRALWAEAGARLGMLGGSGGSGGWVGSSQPGGGTTFVNITVPVSAGAVGNERFLADTITDAIRNGLKSGALPADWQQR